MASRRKRAEAPVVISLGGSLIVPKTGIDVGFLAAFRKLIIMQVRQGRRFVLICGGGKTSREYQRAASDVIPLTRDDLDWLGIHATRLNAHLLRTLLRGVAEPRVVSDPAEARGSRRKVLVAAGWQPGCSTDYDAVLLAQRLGATTIINLSNITYVFDRDPKKDAGAKAIPRMTWKEFRRLFGGRWDPGLNVPFDPVASKAAERSGMRVIIADGADLANLAHVLAGAPFTGTVIEG